MEDTRINLDLLYTRAVEFFESSDDSCFLAGTRGAVYEEMREVAALSLQMTSESLYGYMQGKRTRALRRSERSG